MDERLEIIYARRSIRAFKRDPLPPALIEELLRAAMAAPSAANRQPWRFLVVTDQKTRQRLADAHPNAQFAAQSPAVIFVFGEPVGELFDQDLAAATENLLVAAAGLGLGACWCGVTDERRPRLHAATGIPPELRIVTMVCVGYPAEQKEPRSQYDAAKVYYEQYAAE
jgi:nitroreductase